jgi:hypothetical protein
MKTWSLLGIALMGTTACGSSDSAKAASATSHSTKDAGGNSTSDAGNNTASDAGGFRGPAPVIPDALEACPTLATGTVTVLGSPVQMFVGTRQEDKKAPLLFYWHGTGSVSGEASALIQNQIDEITADGGLVASFTDTMPGVAAADQGDYTGPFVWHQDDFQMADQILACAVQQLNIDTRRIYSAGCSAGGLQSGAMAYERSSYIAAVLPNSGGVGLVRTFQEPAHIPNVITAHGAPGVDVVVLDFSGTSATFDDDIVAHGGFAVDCNHGGGHCGAPPDLHDAQWQFAKDHPFGVYPEPYAAGLPSTFPSYCQIVAPQ